MKKIICKVEYDTEKATLIKKATRGIYGDPKGYEECLYRTEDGKYFIYGLGGKESPYPEETIKRMAVAKAQAWLEEN